MVDEILGPVRDGKRVCAVFYGHPGVYVEPSHDAVRRAREEGFEARMLPAVSAEDCLVADLGVDPGESGWQSWEATSFLLHGFRPDPTAGLVLWQVDGIGKLDWDLDPDPRGLAALADVLVELYPPEHELLFYRASIYPIAVAWTTRVRLDELRRSRALPPARCTSRRSLPAGRRGDGGAARPHAVVAVRSDQGAGAVGGDGVALRLVQRNRALDALAGPVKAACRAKHDRELEEDVATEVEQIGGLDDRERLPRDALRLVGRARIGEEPCAGEPVEHLRPEVLLGRCRLHLADELASASTAWPRACSVRASIAATEARWPISPRLPSAS